MMKWENENVLNWKWNKKWKFTDDEEQTVDLMKDIMKKVNSDKYLTTIDGESYSKFNEKLTYLLLSLENANYCISTYFLIYLTCKLKVKITTYKLFDEGVISEKEIMEAVIEEVMKFFDEEGKEIEEAKKTFGEKIEESENIIKELNNSFLTKDEQKIKKWAMKYYYLLKKYEQYFIESDIKIQKEVDKLFEELEKED